MCNRKPLGRCASAIESTRASLIAKEEILTKNISYLKMKKADPQLIIRTETKLQQIKKDQFKNEIDFYASIEGQEKFNNASHYNPLSTQDNAHRVLGISRKTWQITFSKKLFELENSSPDKAEGLHYAAASAKHMLSVLEYEYNAKLSLIETHRESLKNPQLTVVQKTTIQEKVNKLNSESYVTELNIADTHAYLNYSEKKFNSLIQGFLYTEPQHV